MMETFPDSEKFGLTSQMRRTSVSIPSNIAEEYGRRSKKDLHHFFHIAYGSALNWKYKFPYQRPF
jgi:four helix bundle protein